MSSRSGFWDRIAPKYAADPIKDMTSYEYTLGRTLFYLTPRDRVLELGCGTASTAIRIAPHVAHLTATDYSAAMVEIGQAKVAASGLGNLVVSVADPEEGSMPDGPFDVVLAFNLLHLLGDPEAAIGRIHKQLRPGGLFISKTACLQGIWRAMALPVGLMRLVGKAPAVSFFSTRWLEAAVLRQGFEIVESGDFPRSPPRRYIVARRR